MPYMTPTYPENIRLLGPSTWEEKRNQQTNRLPTGIPPPSHALCMWLIADFLYPSLARFACSAWIKKSNSFIPGRADTQTWQRTQFGKKGWRGKDWRSSQPVRDITRFPACVMCGGRKDPE